MSLSEMFRKRRKLYVSLQAEFTFATTKYNCKFY